MKKIVLLVTGILFLAGFTSAYQVDISAPDTLAVGKPLIVNGTTTFGIGTPIDVVLYYQLTTTTEIKRKIVYVQSDYTFRAVFDTTGLQTGMYKVEVPTSGMGDSITMRVVNLIDRSDDIQMNSPLYQNFDGKMSVAGTIRGDENSGVQIEVIGPDNLVVFGPFYINTNYQGGFATEVPIKEPGDYEVIFTDAKGYVGNRIITVAGQQPLTSGTNPAATKTVVVSAHTKSSRDNPAYFAIMGGSRLVTIHTSSSIDWILEYADDKGVIHVVNEENEKSPEKVQVQGKGQTIYIKAYPLSNSVTSEVFVYAENATSIVISSTIPAPFAAAAPKTTTPQSPIIPILGAAAVGLAILLIAGKHESR
ncbi:MAG TPA: hypothetical protein VJ350_01255 [Methanoregula sp.]|nr:hypothetical protein [Methanoregula sp.]